jgi:hypothetical protein
LSINSRMSRSLGHAPLFSIGRCWTFGPHQSPIRFKALGESLLRVSSRPWQSRCPRKLSVPRRVQGYSDHRSYGSSLSGVQPKCGSRRGRTI